MEFKNLRIKELVCVEKYKNKTCYWQVTHANTHTLKIKLNGTAIHDFGNKKLTLTENCISFINRSEAHTIQLFGNEDEDSDITLHFTTYDPIDTESFAIKIPNCSELISLFEKIAVRISLSTGESALSAISYFYRVCAIFENYRQKEYAPVDARMMKAREYIDLNFTNKDCLVAAAEVGELSRRRFNELFRNQYGITPNRYLISRKIEYATRLLKASNLSISDIAELSGFTDIYYFSKVFKLETGYSPTRFKQKI